MRKIVLSFCLLLAAPTQAATWQVLGGSLFASDALGTSGRPSYSATLTPGTPGQLIEGAYQAGGEIFNPVTPTEGPNPLGFHWPYGMNFYTTNTNSSGASLAAPTINVNGLADMSSFTVGWYEIVLESVGDSAVVPVTNNLDGTYSITWLVRSPYDFGNGDYVPTSVTMNLAPVPIPAAAWLLGSGLLGLLGAARIRRVSTST